MNEPILTTNWVPGEGPKQASMWFIGEAPGAVEDKLLRPFAGPAGHYYEMGLRDAGIMRSETFTWNVFPMQPPKNDVGFYFSDKKHTVLTQEGDLCTQELIATIKQYKPTVIVALGATAMWFLAGSQTQGITKMRGSIMPCVFDHEIKVYPTYHPSYVMRLMQEAGETFSSKKMGISASKGMNVYPTFIKDLERAKEQSYDRSFPLDNRDYVLPDTISDVTAYLSSLPYNTPIACDIETLIEKPPIITRIGFAESSQRGMSIPFIKRGALCWTLDEWAEILIKISEVMLSGRVFIYQNGFFDLTVMGKLHGLRQAENTVLDTMVQQHCVYPYLPKGLDYQCSVYTWQPYYKDDRKKHKAGLLSDEALSIYNIRDCCVTKEIQPITLRDIREQGMEEGYNRTLSVYPSLLFMMMKGVRIDIKMKEELKEKFRTEIEKADATIYEHARQVINPASPKQLAKLLYGTMGFPSQINRKTNTLTTNIGALMKLEKSTGHPIFKALRNFRKYSKLHGTYTKMEVGADGRIYTSYDPTGTATWRLNSRESHLGVGTNLQNLPKRTDEGRQIRKLFIPDDGFEFLAWDKSQAEDRVVTFKAGDEQGIQAYMDGADPHWENAKLLFKLPKTEAYDKSNANHYRMRNKIAKHAKHAGNYGMGPIQLRDMLITMADFWDYDVADCKALLESQRAAKPRIEQWKHWVRQQIRMNRTLTSVIGRKRKFLGRINDDMFRKAYAFDPQNTVGEAQCVDIQAVYDQLVDKDFQILMNVHDECVAQVRIGMKDKYISKILEICQQPITVEDIFGMKRDMVIPIEFSVGPNFGELEEIKI